jgi:ABC-type Zn uptake system ZnuABC Zn-binding protein ZnuA
MVMAVLETLELPYVQDALWVLGPLAIASGILGTWIILRGLAFYSHAVGTAAFPGLVLADGLGFAAPLGALGAAGVLAAGVWLVTRGRLTSPDSATAVVLAGCLAGGVILASDVFESGSNIETLLFGSLLVVGSGDIALALGVAGLTLALTIGLGPRWLARGFDPGQAPHASRALDAVLLAAVALAAVAALSVVGALLATALLVVPAATTRLWFDRLLPWQVATVALTAAEGAGGVLLAVETDAPPGATIAVLAGGIFVLSAGAKVARRQALAPAALAVAVALALGGCGAGAGGDDGEVHVIATTPHIAEFAREVGDGRVRVTQLLGTNTDPHDYEPRPSDIALVAQADLVLKNGMGLDEWVDDVVERSGGDPRVVDLSAGLPVKRSDDPHWFQDPLDVEAATRGIERAYSDAAAQDASAFRASGDSYRSRLRALHAELQRCFSSVPRAQRKLVTDHDAFGYFAERYGIEVVGAVFPSQSTQSQASAGEIADLARVIEREDVKAVFPSKSLNPDVAEALADQTGVTAEESLFSDALGPEASGGVTYAGSLRHNADAMVLGFTGGETRCPAR